MQEIRRLRENYNDNFQELLHRLHARFGEDPLRMWERKAAEGLLYDRAQFGGMRAALATNGVSVRTRQLRDYQTLVQV